MRGMWGDEIGICRGVAFRQCRGLQRELGSMYAEWRPSESVFGYASPDSLAPFDERFVIVVPDHQAAEQPGE